MADIDWYQADDRRGVEQFYRRTFGTEAADARPPAMGLGAAQSRQSGRRGPFHWIVREGPTVIAACPLIPVRVEHSRTRRRRRLGRRSAGRAERQRPGSWRGTTPRLGSAAGVALGAHLSDGTRFLLEKIHWPKPVTLPCLVKPLSRRALRRPTWPCRSTACLGVRAAVPGACSSSLPAQPLAGTGREPSVASIADTRSPSGSAWRRGSIWRCGATRRYSTGNSSSRRTSAIPIAILQPRRRAAWIRRVSSSARTAGRVTQIVDFLVDPADERGLNTAPLDSLRGTIAEDSDKIRCYVQHARFRRVLRRSGAYFVVKSHVQLHAKINAVQVPPDFSRGARGLALHVGRWEPGLLTPVTRSADLQVRDLAL